MTRKVRKSCKLCQHPDRDGIEEDILAGNITCDEVDKQNNWWFYDSQYKRSNCFI